MTERPTSGRCLRVGDRIRVWWSITGQAACNQDVITKLTPYIGPLDYLFQGASLAEFLFSRAGMTIEHDRLDLFIKPQTTK